MGTTFHPTRRQALATLLASASPWPSAAQTGATYAILSLIGDAIEIVTPRSSTGTQLQLSDRDEVPIDNAALDDVAVGAADAAIGERFPQARRLRVSIRDKRLFALQDRLLDGGTDTDGMRRLLRTALEPTQATHLVLVCKHRADASFEVESVRTGGGKVRGLGFYLGATSNLHRIGHNELEAEYIAAYASIAVAVVSAPALQAAPEHVAFESEVKALADAQEAGSAWQAMTPDQKMRSLGRAIDRAVFAATRSAVGAG